jgi:hypothetical protein
MINIKSHKKEKVSPDLVDILYLSVLGVMELNGLTLTSSSEGSPALAEFRPHYL